MLDITCYLHYNIHMREGQVKRKPRYVKTPKPPIVLGNRGNFSCRYCGRTFSSEKTVARHLCEQRRRYDQRNTLFCTYGFEAYSAIQTQFLGRNHKKTEEDFRKSDFYLACVKWGHFVIDIHCINTSKYLEWLLKLNVPIDQWALDNVYDCWLQAFVLTEDPWEAFERSMKKTAEWGEEVDKPFKDYFRAAGTARVLTDVRKGWITGWILFCSESGTDWLKGLSSGDLELVWAWLDVSRWKIRLEKYHKEVTEFCHLCQTAGL